MTLTMTTIAFVVINCYFAYSVCNNENDISAKLLSTCESRKKDAGALDKSRLLQTPLVMLGMGNFPAFSISLRKIQKSYNPYNATTIMI